MTLHGQQLKAMTFQVFHDLCEPSGYRIIESVTVTGSPGTEKPEFSQLQESVFQIYKLKLTKRNLMWESGIDLNCNVKNTINKR